MHFSENTKVYTCNLKSEIRVNLVNMALNRRKKRIAKEPEFDEETGELLLNEKSVKDSLRRARVAVVDYGILNEFDYFGTFTISSEMCGDLLFNPYAMKDKLSKLLNNFKKLYAPDLQYIFVPELGEKNRRLHFHFLMKNVPSTCIELNKNKKLDLPYFSSRVGFVQIDRIRDKVGAAKYCSKYISKDNVKLGKHRYFCSKGLQRGERAQIGDLFLAVSIQEWLEMEGFMPYTNKKSCCYALPNVVFYDLEEKVIKPYLKQFEKVSVWDSFQLLPDDTPCPFDKMEFVQLCVV